jgi:hypothetical protein
MDNYNVETFLNIKNSIDCQILDSDIIEFILNNFMNTTKDKKYKSQTKKTINILKNPKIKIIKDKISNKVNLILNKISENNIENLVIEFIENIKLVNIEEYNEFLKIIYYKILSEINFLKFYLKFLGIISEIYFIEKSYTLKYFFNMIENKFQNDYYDIIDNDYLFLKDFEDDSRRLNNLTLIYEMIKINYFNKDFELFIENLLINQTKYLGDIHHWFKDINLSDSNKLRINNLINDNTQLRDKILLDSLINKTDIDIKQSKIIYKKPLITNTIVKNNIELENMLEEYLFIDNYESLEQYIKINCCDAIGKNKFCEFIITKYFKLSQEEDEKILILFKSMIKKKILFKSNLSRALLNIHNNKMNNDKLKSLLLFLKNMGITNCLENLMMKFKILFKIFRNKREIKEYRFNKK